MCVCACVSVSVYVCGTGLEVGGLDGVERGNLELRTGGGVGVEV